MKSKLKFMLVLSLICILIISGCVMKSDNLIEEINEEGGISEQNNQLESSQILESEAGVKYDSRIVEKLKIEKNVLVTIDIKDAKEVYKNNLIDRTNRFNKNLELQEQIINDLEKNGFNLTSKSVTGAGWINGWITHKGLDKLKTDERILSITFPEVLHTQK